MVLIRNTFEFDVSSISRVREKGTADDVNQTCVVAMVTKDRLFWMKEKVGFLQYRTEL